MDECPGHVRKAVDQPVEHEGDRSPTRGNLGRGLSPDGTQVRMELGETAEEPVTERLGHSVARCLSTNAAKGIEQWGTADVGGQETTENAGTVLSAGKTEVGKQGYRPAGPGAKQTKNRDGLDRIGVRKEHLASVGPVTPEYMGDRANGTDAVFRGYQATRIRQIPLDSSGDLKYSLHVCIASMQ